MKRFTLTIVLEANDEEDIRQALGEAVIDFENGLEPRGEGTAYSSDCEYRWELKDGEKREHLPRDLR